VMNIVYGIANLANYIVGAGILGLPFVFSKTGWAVGCFLILLAAFATSLSFDFLLQASTASGCFSYDALALRTGGIRLQKVKSCFICKTFRNLIISCLHNSLSKWQLSSTHLVLYPAT
jgi:hypothetical protein